MKKTKISKKIITEKKKNTKYLIEIGMMIANNAIKEIKWSKTSYNWVKL